jgi:hypothetical protein
MSTKISKPVSHQDIHKISCRWLEEDAPRALSAEVVRLIVDKTLWGAHRANDAQQQLFFRQIMEYIDQTCANQFNTQNEEEIANGKVIACPAGTITMALGESPAPTMEALTKCLSDLQRSLETLDFGSSRHEIFVGADGCIPGEMTPTQTVVHVMGKPEVSFHKATVKLYPTSKEERSLLGWLICKPPAMSEELKPPPELALARRIRTSVGLFFILVCHEGGSFYGRILKNCREGKPRRLLVEYFNQQVLAQPAPDYVLMATHRQGIGPRGGHKGTESKNAAKKLDEMQIGTTVVTTLFAPGEELEIFARRFPVRGPRKEKVATLLVRKIEAGNA